VKEEGVTIANILGLLTVFLYEVLEEKKMLKALLIFS